MSFEHLAEAARWGETPDMDGYDVEQLSAVLGFVASEMAALRLVQSAARTRMGVLLGVGGWAKLGRFVYRYSRERTLRLRGDRTAAFWAEAEKPGVARRLFNANYARNGQLKDVFGGYVDAETGEVGLGALFDWAEADEPTVQEIPLDRAPKYMQESGDGVYGR